MKFEISIRRYPSMNLENYGYSLPINVNTRRLEKWSLLVHNVICWISKSLQDVFGSRMFSINRQLDGDKFGMDIFIDINSGRKK